MKCVVVMPSIYKYHSIMRYTSARVAYLLKCVCVSVRACVCVIVCVLCVYVCARTCVCLGCVRESESVYVCVRARECVCGWWVSCSLARSPSLPLVLSSSFAQAARTRVHSHDARKG